MKTDIMYFVHGVQLLKKLYQEWVYFTAQEQNNNLHP
jgi:hypothetical protein